MDKIKLEDLTSFKSKKPEVSVHGVWADKFRYIPSGYEIKDPINFIEDILPAHSQAKPVVVKASTDHVVTVLHETTEEGKERITVEDDKGEHLYLRVSKELGSLIILPTRVKVFHEQNEDDELTISSDYWEAEINAAFLKNVTVEEYYENIEKYKNVKLNLRLNLNSRNGKVAVTEVEKIVKPD